MYNYQKYVNPSRNRDQVVFLLSQAVMRIPPGDDTHSKTLRLAAMADLPQGLPEDVRLEFEDALRLWLYARRRSLRKLNADPKRNTRPGSIMRNLQKALHDINPEIPSQRQKGVASAQAMLDWFGTQTKLGEVLGVSQPTISGYLKRGIPRHHTDHLDFLTHGEYSRVAR